MKRISLLIKVFASIMASQIGVHGVQTQEKNDLSYTELSQGKLLGVSLSNEGVVQLAPQLNFIAELEDAIIWKAIADKEGNVFLATGNRNAVYKVSPQGEKKILFQAEETLIHALTVDSKGNLFVGTSPEGQVYRIQEGHDAEVYFDPGTVYIWDLVVDKNDNLYVATGHDAKIYRLPPNHKVGDEEEVWFEAVGHNITKLVLDQSSQLLAATSPDAMLYKITGQGEARVLCHMGTDEIVGICPFNGGEVMFATLNQEGSSNPSISNQGPTGSVGTSGDPASFTGLLDSMAIDGIFLLNREGFVEPYWIPMASKIYSLENYDGQWLVGSGGDGNLYAVKGQSEWALVNRAPHDGNINNLIKDPKGGIFVIASNPAAVYHLGAELEKEGLYESSVFDAGQIASWGSIQSIDSNEAPSNILWLTRTGNSKEPDSTWSNWEAVSPRIKSPMGRYFQYRALFQGNPKASFKGVNVYYRIMNAAPIVRKIVVLPIGADIVAIPAKSISFSLGDILGGASLNDLISQTIQVQLNPNERTGLKMIAWEAFDPNGDQLTYTLQIKQENPNTDSMSDWITLVKDIIEPVYSFNSVGMPDGYYRVKVIASDAFDNPRGEGKTGELVSPLFLIDNAIPNIFVVSEGGKNGSYQIIFKVEDGYSVLRGAQYILDGGEAVPLLAQSGFFDSQEATFEVRLEKLTPGKHSLIFEVIDDSYNRAVSMRLFDVK